MTAARLDMVPHSLNSGQYPVAGEDLHTAITVHGDGKSSRAPSVRKIDRRAIPDTDFAGCGDRAGVKDGTAGKACPGCPLYGDFTADSTFWPSR